MVRQYFDYTNDLELMREIFPDAGRHRGVGEPPPAARERGPLREQPEHLDQRLALVHPRAMHAGVGLHARRAIGSWPTSPPRLGKDPAPFAAEAGAHPRGDAARAVAAQTRACSPSTRHAGPPAAAPGARAADDLSLRRVRRGRPLQIYQMLALGRHPPARRSARPAAASCTGAPTGFPTSGRSYTHSTYEMAYAEELNFALTNYLAGRADEGYALLRASLCGIFNGPTPGGLSCHTYADGRQRPTTSSPTPSACGARAVVRRAVRHRPERADSLVRLDPRFPRGWPEAEIRTPHFAYRWERSRGTERIAWEAPREVRPSAPADTGCRCRAGARGRPTRAMGGRARRRLYLAARRSRDGHVGQHRGRVPALPGADDSGAPARHRRAGSDLVAAALADATSPGGRSSTSRRR